MRETVRVLLFLALVTAGSLICLVTAMAGLIWPSLLIVMALAVLAAVLLRPAALRPLPGYSRLESPAAAPFPDTADGSSLTAEAGRVRPPRQALDGAAPAKLPPHYRKALPGPSPYPDAIPGEVLHAGRG